VNIRGTVRDQLTIGTGAPVANASLSAVYKSGAGPVATSLDDGSFLLNGVRAAEPFELRITKTGYEPATRTISPELAGPVEVALLPLRTTVTGTVTETAPTETTAVAGAQIEILTGSSRGRVTTTDPRGGFSLPNVWGDFELSISRPNYETRLAQVESGTTWELELRLAPVQRLAHASFGAELCTIEPLPAWLRCSAPFERVHDLAITRPGTLTLLADYTYVGDYYFNDLTVQIRCGSTVIVEKHFRKQSDAPPFILPDNVRGGAMSVALLQPCTYDIRVFDFRADTKGGAQTAYRINIDYPRQ
jgi:hypothetical protein